MFCLKGERVLNANLIRNKKQNSGIRGEGKKRGFQLISLAAIPLIYVIIFSYIPMFGLIIAFKNYRFDKGILGSDWVGLKNFEYFFKSSDFGRVIRNTISLNMIFIVVGMACAVALGILLYELRSRTKTKIYQTIMILPYFISWVIVGYMVYAFLNPSYGLANAIFAKFGMEPVKWYSEPKFWPFILTIAFVWKNVGIDCVIYYAALMGIDSSLFEAAEIDGAGKWQKIRYITLPCLRSIVIMLFILKVGGIFRADFGLFYQLTRDVGALYSTTDVMDTYIFRTLKTVRDYGMSSAAGLLQSVVGFITVIITNWIVKKIDSDSALL